MTKTKVLQFSIGIIFLIVGVLSVVNAVRFDQYVRDTVQRDTAQEQCQAETLFVLKQWAVARTDELNRVRERNEITGSLLDRAFRNEPIPESDIDDFNRRDQAVIVAQDHVHSVFTSLPLPDCKVKQ